MKKCALIRKVRLITRVYGIYFGYPRSDTCDTCDSLLTKMEEAWAKGDVTEGLEQELKAHKSFAEKGYQAFYYNQKLSKESWQNTHFKLT